VTTVLLSGFEPFDGAESNSSWDAAQLVERDWRGAASVSAVVLPVEFGTAWQRLEHAIAEHEPDVVIAVGLADDRTAVTPERVAINLQDARIPDNAGAQPRDLPVLHEAPAAYFTGLPVVAIADAIRAAAIPAGVSLSAGAYVCNDLMYRMLHEVESRRPHLVAGFIHVPSAETMPIETIARGLTIAVELTVQSFEAQSFENQGG
jgi:pyroglutamyl-peptidase